MRKQNFVTLMLRFDMTNPGGRTETPVYNAIAGYFKDYYNSTRYDSIFMMFSDEMQKALPLEKTIEFLAGLKSSAGQITKFSFVKYVNDSIAEYKTNFERALFAVNISLDSNDRINGLLVKPYISDSLPAITRNTTNLILPFTGEWTVLWGGDTKELNYHADNPAQKNAFDFLITDSSGSSHTAQGENNEDYYAFGKQIIAPCNGEVILSVDGIKDNLPGVFNRLYIPGNSLIIKTADNEYIVFAHFKKQSIVVKEGQKVQPGDLLGLCGNSGNSSEPHLHFHIQNGEDLYSATAVKCYFEEIIVNGELRSDYSPVKAGRIKNP